MMPALAIVLLAAGASPAVALLSSDPATGLTELRFQPLIAEVLAPVAAQLTHAPGESVLGALLPDGRVAVTAVPRAKRDLSFAAALYLLEKGGPPRLLCEDVALANRPLVAEGRLFVQRGHPGPLVEPSDDGKGSAPSRVDALEVSEVVLAGPQAGLTRAVHRFTGYTAFLVGALGRELLVYRVGPAGADLVAVQMDTTAVRPVVKRWPALARDFVVDPGGAALWLTQGDAQTGQWHVERVDLRTGERQAFAAHDSMALLPTVLPGGRAAFAPARGAGLTFVESGAPASSPLFADGWPHVLARVPGEAVAVGLHERASDFPTPFAFRLDDGAPWQVRAPPGQQLDLAGVLP